MIKKLLLTTIAAVLCSLSLLAQKSDWGGVKGTVVNRAGKAPIASAVIMLSQNGTEQATATTDAEGKFLIEGLQNGIYDMTVKAPGFLDANVNDQEAIARPPPDIPYKPELDQAQRSVVPPSAPADD